jgi:hypothetical protein
VGVDAEGAITRLGAMRRLLTGAGQKISGVHNIVAKSETIEGMLAEKRAAFKRVAASVGMHLDPRLANATFCQIGFAYRSGRMGPRFCVTVGAIFFDVSSDDHLFASHQKARPRPVGQGPFFGIVEQDRGPDRDRVSRKRRR